MYGVLALVVPVNEDIKIIAVFGRYGDKLLVAAEIVYKGRVPVRVRGSSFLGFLVDNAAVVGSVLALRGLCKGGDGKSRPSARAAQSAVKVLRIFLFILGVLHFFGVVVCGFCGVARRGFHARNTAPGKHSGKLMRGKAHGAHKLYDFAVFRFGFLRFKPP